MHRIDNSKFLLYIEPKAEQKSIEPINDKITKTVEFSLKNAKKGVSNYSNINEEERFIIGLNDDGEPVHYYGFHVTDCGEWSSNVDYLLGNGMITNSLCVFYLQYYREVIPESEMQKVMKLCEWANEA